MATLENLDPAVRLEDILDRQDIEPATRLEYFLKKAAEGGGSSGGLVEIKNVEPFQVPDLVNGGTRLFDPASDSLYIMNSENGDYNVVSNAFISNDTPPAIVRKIDSEGQAWSITIMWFEVQTYEITDAISSPHFCVAPSTVYGFRAFAEGFIIKPASIVYKYTTSK